MLNSLRKNPDLQRCDIASLWEAMDAAAVAGIEIGGPTPLAYLVPYGKQCQLIISYRGLMELARRSGKVKNIAVGVVHEGDEFVPPADALEPQLIHKQSTDPKRMEQPITHVWCGYLMHDGTRVYDIMTADEIEVHKKRYAKGYDKPDSAWVKSWDTMALKTVLKRPINRGLVPVAQRAERLLEMDNVLDGTADHVASEVSVVAPQQIEHEVLEQTPPAPPAMTRLNFEAAAEECDNAGQCDHMRDEYEERYPEQKADIIEVFDARIEQLDILEAEKMG